MPIYLYKNPKTEEIIEVVQKMDDPHVYSDEEGLEWDRIFTSPNMNVTDNLIGADTTEKEFVRKTHEKNYSLGDMWDLSAELSEKRKRVNGKDPIKEKAQKKYERRTGKKHPHSGGKQDNISI